MSEKFNDIGVTVFVAVSTILMFLPLAAFSWLVTVSLWDAVLKITGAWK